MATKNGRIQEFGDFQTPLQLAHGVCSLLAKRGVAPTSVLEPTCGEGNFLVAALRAFPEIKNAVGMDINPGHIDRAQAAMQAVAGNCAVEIRRENFFSADWGRVIDSLPEPLLVIGNPPWVTNSALGCLGASNAPEKANFQNYRGIDAITGKSNFDVSEWMILKTLDWIVNKQAVIAMLCKTSVARKVLRHAWKTGKLIAQADIYRIDAAAHFGVAVDACLLVINSSLAAESVNCRIYDNLSEHVAPTVMKYDNGRLLANEATYKSWSHLERNSRERNSRERNSRERNSRERNSRERNSRERNSRERNSRERNSRHAWRSGIKHDCSKIMELRELNGEYRNGLGESASMETDYLYPMLKSSDIAKVSEPRPSRLMLVPQRFVGEDTSLIKRNAPKTWEYLENHLELLQRRASSIYRDRPKSPYSELANTNFRLGKLRFPVCTRL